MFSRTCISKRPEIPGRFWGEEVKCFPDHQNTLWIAHHHCVTLNWRIWEGSSACRFIYVITVYNRLLCNNWPRGERPDETVSANYTSRKTKKYTTRRKTHYPDEKIAPILNGFVVARTGTEARLRRPMTRYFSRKILIAHFFATATICKIRSTCFS